MEKPLNFSHHLRLVVNGATRSRQFIGYTLERHLQLACKTYGDDHLILRGEGGLSFFFLTVFFFIFWNELGRKIYFHVNMVTNSPGNYKQ